LLVVAGGAGAAADKLLIVTDCGKEHEKDNGEQYVAQSSDRFCFDMGAAGLIPDRRAAVTQHLPRKPGGDEHHDRDAQPQPFDIGPEGTFPG